MRRTDFLNNGLRFSNNRLYHYRFFISSICYTFLLEQEAVCAWRRLLTAHLRKSSCGMRPTTSQWMRHAATTHIQNVRVKNIPASLSFYARAVIAEEPIEKVHSAHRCIVSMNHLRAIDLDVWPLDSWVPSLLKGRCHALMIGGNVDRLVVLPRGDDNISISSKVNCSARFLPERRIFRKWTADKTISRMEPVQVKTCAYDKNYRNIASVKRILHVHVRYNRF